MYQTRRKVERINQSKTIHVGELRLASRFLRHLSTPSHLSLHLLLEQSDFLGCLDFPCPDDDQRCDYDGRG